MINNKQMKLLPNISIRYVHREKEQEKLKDLKTC